MSTQSMQFYAHLGDLKIEFEDLCGPCEKTVRGYLGQINRPMEKPSPDRKPKTAQEEAIELLTAKKEEIKDDEEKSKLPQKRKSKVIPLTPGEDHVIPMTVDGE